jgi:diguanylate cyclase (GGDEF)-like protein/PAS domain S-box-containing protein
MQCTITPFINRRETEHKAIESVLLDSEKFKSAILTAALDCIIAIDRHGMILSVNQAAERTFGYRGEDVLGTRLTDIVISPEWREAHREDIERFFSTGESRMFNRRVELTAMRANGARFPIELAVVPLNVENRPIFAAFIRDITERKRTEALQLGQNRILNMVATGASLSGILTEIARFADDQNGRGLCSITQLKDDGMRIAGSIAPGLPPAFVAELGNAAAEPGNGSCGPIQRGEAVTVTDIATDPLWSARRGLAFRHGVRACSSWPIFGRNRNIVGTFTLYFREPVPPSDTDLQLMDICTKLAGIAIESRAAEERIRHLAHYDGLTSLPNRFLFQDYLDLALRNAHRHGQKFAVLFLDLDKFKDINDTLGHDAGDLVLRETATRMRGCVRHTDKIARMGGDEFYVLIEELRDGRHAAEVAQKLLDATARPIHVGSQACHLSASIGIALYPDDGDDGQTLLKNADDAMYHAKECGKNAFRFFSLQPVSGGPDLPMPRSVTLKRR